MSAIQAFIERTPREAQHVLDFYGDPLGVDPGAFGRHIIRAAFHADPERQAQLAKVFPLTVALVRLAKAQEVDVLRSAAVGNAAALDRIAQVLEMVEAAA